VTETTRSFPTIAEACAWAKREGLRHVLCSITSEPRADQPPNYIVRCEVAVGDGHYVAHGTGATVEQAETRSIARALSLGLGVTIGNGSPA